MLCDIYYFKEYHENYGHAVGDECICQCTSILKEIIREDGDIIRYGGDEFCILLPGIDKVTLESYMKGIQERLRIENIPHIYSKSEPYVTVSQGGLSTTITPTDKQEQLLELVDGSLYKSKNIQRGSYWVEERS